MASNGMMSGLLLFFLHSISPRSAEAEGRWPKMPARRAFPGIGHAVHQSNGAGDCGSRSPGFVLSHLPGDLLTDVTFALSISTNEWVAPCGASLHCQGRSLFRPLDSPGDTGGSLLPFIVGTTLTSDFVSQLIFLFFTPALYEK